MKLVAKWMGFKPCNSHLFYSCEQVSNTRKPSGPRGCAISASHVVMGGGAPFVATPARAVRACLRCNGDTGGVQLRLLPVDAVAEAAAAAAIAGAAAGDPRYHVVRCNATKRAREGGSSGGGAPTLPRPALHP